MYILKITFFYPQDSLLCTEWNSNFWNWHTDPSWFASSSLAVPPAPLSTTSSWNWACARSLSLQEASWLIFTWLAWGDSSKAVPAIQPTTSHWLRHPFCGCQQGIIFTFIIGFILPFWFDLHVSVSANQTINSLKTGNWDLLTVV